MHCIHYDHKLTAIEIRRHVADNKIPVASTTCVHWHSSGRFFGDKIVITTAFADDLSNAQTSSVTVMHVGDRDSFSRLSGIHGAHMGKIEYVATDTTNQTIPWIGKTNDNGSVTEFGAPGSNGLVVGQRRFMDCIDCHNRAAHAFDTPEDALNKDMAPGIPSASLPFVHREGLALIKAKYKSQADARTRIIADLITFYRSQYPAVWHTTRADLCSCEGTCRPLRHQRLSFKERYLGHASQQYRAQRLSRLLSLPRWQPHVQRRSVDHQRLMSLPESVGVRHRPSETDHRYRDAAMTRVTSVSDSGKCVPFCTE